MLLLMSTLFATVFYFSTKYIRKQPGARVSLFPYKNGPPTKRKYKAATSRRTPMACSLLAAFQRGKSVNIGILDDNTAVLDYLDTALSADGHLVFRHATGESLLNAIFALPSSPKRPARYDLVVLDLLLPGNSSGADVFMAIRKSFVAEDLPIIVITAVDEHTLAQFRRILPDDVHILRKPFHPRVLRRIVSQLALTRSS
jgi:CheY-like chemotaxis protein